MGTPGPLEYCSIAKLDLLIKSYVVIPSLFFCDCVNYYYSLFHYCAKIKLNIYLNLSTLIYLPLFPVVFSTCGRYTGVVVDDSFIRRSD